MNHFIRKTVFLMIFVFALFSTSALAETWEAGPPISEGAEEVVGTGVGNAMLVYGGLGPSYEPLGILGMLDAIQGKWTELPSSPIPVHHPAIVAVGNKVYLFGGFVKPEDEVSWKPIDHAFMFDMETRTWSSLKPLPTARGALTASAVGSRIFVIGGATLPEKFDFKGLTFNRPTKQLTVNEVYDTESNTWSEAEPIPMPRNHMSAATVDGKIYVIEGRIGSAYISMSTNSGVNEVYDPVKDR